MASSSDPEPSLQNVVAPSKLLVRPSTGIPSALCDMTSLQMSCLPLNAGIGKAETHSPHNKILQGVWGLGLDECVLF